MSHVRIGPSSSNPVSSNTHSAGADPEIEEGGGGIHIDWGLVRRA